VFFFIGDINQFGESWVIGKRLILKQKKTTDWRMQIMYSGPKAINHPISSLSFRGFF